MLSHRILTFAIASFAAVCLHAESSEHPPTYTPDGAAPLSRAGQATRNYLLGSFELYSIALYADSIPLDRVRLTGPDVPKALRVEIMHREDLNRRRVSIDWQRELIPHLESAAVSHLRAAFAALRHGDVVLIDYVPGKGTTVRVNKSVAVGGADHDLMLSFLDHWIGQRPVSEEIKRALLGSL